MNRTDVFILTATLLGSGVLTGAVRRYALAYGVLDIPIERSSHALPTPRGGGMAIGIALLGAFVYGAIAGRMDRPVVEALLGGGVLVAAIGWLDDHGGVRARYRMLVHFAAAAWALWRLGGYPDVSFGLVHFQVGPAGSMLAVLGIGWCVNFYNFMDGIDGIAGVEGLTVGVCGTFLLVSAGLPTLGMAAAIVAAATAGFLVWNWPPARIFMGDVGSGLLGFMFAVLAVASENRGGPPVAVWGLLLGVFVFDATVTLVRRLRRGEAPWKAHRHHAYQRAMLSGHSHRAVTLGVLGINLVLCALAVAGTRYPRYLPAALVVGFALLAFCFRRIEVWLPMWWATDALDSSD